MGRPDASPVAPHDTAEDTIRAVVDTVLFARASHAPAPQHAAVQEFVDRIGEDRMSEESLHIFVSARRHTSDCPVVLERWTLAFAHTCSASSAVREPAALLLRSLFSFLRQLPAFWISRALPQHRYALSCTFAPPPDADSDLDAFVRVDFRSVLTSTGLVTLGLAHRTVDSVDVLFPYASASSASSSSSPTRSPTQPVPVPVPATKPAKAGCVQSAPPAPMLSPPRPTMTHSLAAPRLALAGRLPRYEPQLTRFVGSMEENLLSGRMCHCPRTQLPNFTAEMSVCSSAGSMAVAKIRQPFAATYFHLDNSTPYVGSLEVDSLCPAHAPDTEPNTLGLAVPLRGLIQLQLLNPNRTPLKLFLVRYDLRTMADGSKTCLRQRTVAEPGGRALYTIQVAFARESRRELYIRSIRFLFPTRAPDELDLQVEYSYGPIRTRPRRRSSVAAPPSPSLDATATTDTDTDPASPSTAPRQAAATAPAAAPSAKDPRIKSRPPTHSADSAAPVAVGGAPREQDEEERQA